MKATSRLYQGVKPIRARTHLFDQPQPPPPRYRSSPQGPIEPNAHWTDVDPSLRVLKGSLRRCLLTQKVLPVDMMIPLKQLLVPTASGPSKKGASSTSSSGIMLLPKGLQHPRFESKAAGKGGWIMCHAQALADLASRGSYKRINPKLSMPRNVQALQQYTESQLVLRVAQEIEMFCERAKSWPRITTMGTPFEPIERQQTLELVVDDRRQVEMVLDMTTSTTSPTAEAHSDTVVNWIKVLGGEKQVPVWRLGDSISNAVLAPASIRAPDPVTRPASESASRTSANPTALEERDHSTRLLRSITDTLDSTINLFKRRRARMLEPAATTDLPSEATQEPRPSAAQGKIYVFYSPSAAESRSSDDASDDSIIRIKRDLVDLWISCWRIGLWRGEAWKN